MPEPKRETLGNLKEFDVDLASMEDGHYEKDFRIGRLFFEEMENDSVLGADVDVMLDIDKRHGSYLLQFHCEGTMQVPCDRCLDPVDHQVDTDYDVTVRYGEEYDDSKDNLLIIPYNETVLNVASLIYDTLLLTIPLRCVHPEGACNSEMSETLRQHQAPGEEDEADGESDSDIE